MINEATLEARIDNILKSIFPTFQDVNVIHQKSFSIKFGHHNVSIDLEKPSNYPARSIFDILLTIGDRNIILLELKKEGLILTPDDVCQGISYARLISQMPPITLITNGVDIQMYNSYTKEKLVQSELDINIINSIAHSAFNLALNDYKEAVDILLNRDNSIFSKVINQITENKFVQLSGKINDFSKSICDDFQIERELIIDIEKRIAESATLVGIVGQSFSGKTTLLYQFFKKIKSNDDFLLYIDCYDHNYSILQQLANHFTKSSKILISKGKIREWLINSLSYNIEAKFYLLVDNFNNEIPEEIKNEIIELIDIFSGVNQHTLYTIDEFNYKKIAYVENRRYKTIIGEQSKLLFIEELNDIEYRKANRLMLENFKVSIEHGGHFTPEYRDPKVIRHLISLYQENIPEGQYVQILAVPDLDYLNSFAQNKHYTKSIHLLYKKLVICFFDESSLRKNNADLNIIASGTGTICIDTFKKLYPNDLNSLIKSSTIVVRELPNGLMVVVPKISELIAFHSIDIITKIIDKESSTHDYKSICEKLIDLVEPIPYCDIVAAGVLMSFGNETYVELFSELTQELLKTPPRFEMISNGTKALTYIEGIGHLHLNFEVDMDEGGFIVDYLPFAILSQIAGFPLGLINNEEYSTYAFHLVLLTKLGSNENFIRRADARSLKNMKSFESIELDGIGTFVSGHEGIIEPIVQSILKCFRQIPDEIETLCDNAFSNNNMHLIWRIYLALRTMINYSDEKLSNRAAKFIERFNKYFKDSMCDYLTSDIADLQERANKKIELEKLLK